MRSAEDGKALLGPIEVFSGKKQQKASSLTISASMKYVRYGEGPPRSGHHCLPKRGKTSLKSDKNRLLLSQPRGERAGKGNALLF